MSIVKNSFGKLDDGRETFLYTISNENIECSITNYGACITSLKVKDKNNNFVDVVTGFDNVVPYTGKCGSMGFTIGRHANRIANAQFMLDGVLYKLDKNNGNNHLHGGSKSNFTKQLFNAKEFSEKNTLELCLLSPDGEEGYPGNLDFKVVFSIDDKSKLKIEYYAKTDKKTIVNFTNHSYFNLEGHDAGNVFEHYIIVDADHICNANNELIPTGELLPVDGTPFDLRKTVKVANVLENRNSNELMKNAGGLDHNFCLNNNGKKAEISTLYSEKTGIVMKTYTDQPGVQVYTACTTDISGGKDGAHYGNFSSICLETQHYPDSINHDNFPSIVLDKNETFYSVTEYEFGLL